MNTSKSSRGRSMWILTVVCGLLILLGGLPEGTEAQTTTRVSVSTTGEEGNHESGSRSYGATISTNGRIVAFPSQATNLVAGDTNGFQDVFVHDRQTGATTRVSVGPGGQESFDDNNLNGAGGRPSLSADGRLVAWDSRASNLVLNDTNGVSDVFVHDRQTGLTTRVSVDSNGGEANDSSGSPILNGDGRFVAFASGATNLIANDTNRREDIFVHDRQTGQTTRVSVNSSGGEAEAGATEPALSANGRFVAFRSQSNDLVTGDTSTQCVDVFVHDRQTGQTTRASVSSSGVPDSGASGGAGTQNFRNHQLSPDGRVVVFTGASNLSAGGPFDLYEHNLQTGETIGLNLFPNGTSGDPEWFALNNNAQLIAFVNTSIDVFP